ncbi:MAG: HDOD domain-containing protein [Sulfuricella sp.]|nr:HDOD domain-containing protein [Sulfuricella sp.]
MNSPLTGAEQAQIDELLANGIKIPAQPAVLGELEKLIGKPKANIGHIADLVAKDAGLSAIVFKMISSPVYGLRRPAESLEKAISVIGLKQMANIIKCAALRTTIGGKEQYYEWFWERSAEIAQLASIVAWKQRSVCNIFPDQAYMAGLFLECGVPILMNRFPDYCKAFRLSDKNWPDLADEDRRFNTNHCVTGYLLARHWRLPDFICQAVRFHHEILHTEHKATTMVAILQMAIHIHNAYRQCDEPNWDSLRPRVLDELGVGVEGLKEFEEDVLDRR